MALDTFQAHLSKLSRDDARWPVVGRAATRAAAPSLRSAVVVPVAHGERHRPALCLATCRAFGGDASDALASATAIEMLHNAFLVHDDIEDESDLRRGLPTMHAEHGVPIAVNAGDMLTALSVRILRDNLPTLGPAADVAGVRRVRPHDAGVARGPGDGARLGARQPVRRHRRGLPADGPQEDVLVQLHPSLPHRRAHRDEGRRRSRSLQSFRVLPRYGVSDSGRSSQPRRATNVATARRSAETCSRASAR